MLTKDIKILSKSDHIISGSFSNNFNQDDGTLLYIFYAYFMHSTFYTSINSNYKLILIYTENRDGTFRLFHTLTDFNSLFYDIYYIEKFQEDFLQLLFNY